MMDEGSDSTSSISETDINQTIINQTISSQGQTAKTAALKSTKDGKVRGASGKGNITRTNENKSRIQCNNSKNNNESRTSSSQPRIVQSRFRQAAASVALNSNRSGESRSNKSDGGNSSGDTFGSSKPFHSLAQMKRNLGTKNNLLPRKTNIHGAKSTTDLYSSSGKLSSPRLSLAPTGSPKMCKNIPSRTSRVAGKFKKTKLHSTILENSMMSEVGSTSNVFSLTLVGGLAPNGSKIIKNNNSTALFDNTLVSLPELPDISAIKLDGTNHSNHSTESTNSEQTQEHGTLCDISEQDLELEYIRYLTMACLDVKSQTTDECQMKEAQKQLTFLLQVDSEKKREVAEFQQKLELLSQYEASVKTYDNMSKLFEELEPVMDVTDNANEILYNVLERRLHQIQIENIYMPEDNEQYRKQLVASVESLTNTVNELLSYLEPHHDSYEKTNELLSILKDTQYELASKHKVVNQAAALAVQEASLLITQHQKNLDTTETEYNATTVSVT